MAARRIFVSTPTRTLTTAPSYSSVAARSPTSSNSTAPIKPDDAAIKSVTSKRAAKRWLKELNGRVRELEVQKADNAQRILATVASELEALKVRAKDDLALERTAHEVAEKVLR